LLKELLKARNIVDKVFVLFEIHGMQMITMVSGVFTSKELAIAAKEHLENALLPEYKPEYDTYGLVSGIEYSLVEMKTNTIIVRE
jgi:hypothetical protein